MPTRGKRKEGKTKREKRRTHWELRTPAADTRHAFDGAGLPGPMCESGESTPPGRQAAHLTGPGQGCLSGPGGRISARTAPWYRLNYRCRHLTNRQQGSTTWPNSATEIQTQVCEASVESFPALWNMPPGGFGTHCTDRQERIASETTLRPREVQTEERVFVEVEEDVTDVNSNLGEGDDGADEHHDSDHDDNSLMNEPSVVHAHERCIARTTRS